MLDQLIKGGTVVDGTGAPSRVADVGVALAYLPMGSSPSENALPFLDGFESVVPLLPEERAVLPQLVAARLVQRKLLNELLDATGS